MVLGWALELDPVWDPVLVLAMVLVWGQVWDPA